MEDQAAAVQVDKMSRMWKAQIFEDATPTNILCTFAEDKG